MHTYSWEIRITIYYAMQTLNAALENVPRDRNGKISEEYLRVVLDVVSPSAGLPPFGAVDQVCYSSHRSLTFSFNILRTSA